MVASKTGTLDAGYALHGGAPLGAVRFTRELLAARVLVVDDNPTNALLVQTMLERQGFAQVWAVPDPVQALSLCRETAFDLVMLDLSMPELDGFEFMRQLGALSALPPHVIVVTAHSDRATRVRALSGGAHDFVTKPLEHGEALCRIRNLLENRLLQSKLRERNGQLEEKVAERTRELRETRLEIIRRLGLASGYRDNETGLHTIRVSHYSTIMARALALSEEQCDLLLHASPMHDIGKIGIPDHVLLKPGPLNEKEWGVMKTHTTIGAQLLSGHESELMKMAREIALFHHEKWDGSGYPYGLKGELIPQAARIVALCDVFDGLTSVRPYKQVWSVEDAIRFIESGAGTHFDPALVDVFRRVVGSIVDIRRRYDDPDSGLDLAMTYPSIVSPHSIAD